MVNYMERRAHKDYIQLEIVVEKEGQKGILLGKVCCFFSGTGKFQELLYS